MPTIQRVILFGTDETAVFDVDQEPIKWQGYEVYMAEDGRYIAFDEAVNNWVSLGYGNLV